MLRSLLDGQVPLSSVVLVTAKWGREENPAFDAREKQMVESYWADLRAGEVEAGGLRFIRPPFDLEPVPSLLPILGNALSSKGHIPASERIEWISFHVCCN
jgi:hypothetical protein